MMIDVRKDIPLRFRFLEALFLGILRVIPLLGVVKRLRLYNQKKAEEFLLKRRQIQGRKGMTYAVDVQYDLSPEEFKKKYSSCSKPVLLKGVAKNWPCCKKWNFDFLQEKYGSQKFHIVAAEGFMTSEEKKHLNIEGESGGSPKLKNFLLSQQNNGVGNLRFCPIVEENTELINDLDKKWLSRMTSASMGVSYLSFISGKGKITNTHNAMTSFLFVMASGSKKWTLFPAAYYPVLNMPLHKKGYFYSEISPYNDENIKASVFEMVDRYTCLVEEGDVLYVPAWMFHHVENLEDSWGLSYRMSHLWSAIDSSLGLTLNRIFTSSPSFLQIVWHSFYGKPVSKRKKFLMQPKLFKNR